MKKKSPVSVILTVLFGLNILAWIAVYDLSRPDFLEVIFFDVGQGDSIFIETPQRHQILIDGGPDDTVIKKLGKEMPFWDRTIDLMILSHPEHDHLAGLLEVLKRYKVKNILWTGVVRDTAEFQEWQELLQEEQAEDDARIYIAKAGFEISESYLQARRNVLRVLYPFEGLEGEESKDSNNTSIILRLVSGKTSFLFTGDVYQSVEKKLIQPDIELDSDILKVGHHGSKTSSAIEFIEAVSPEIAVIQCGKDNSYGHPHQETFQNLEGIRALRTDLDGDIKIISDSTSYQISL